MLSILTTLFASGALKWVGAGIAALVALVLAWFHGKSTGTQQAATQVHAAEVETQIAQMGTVNAKADADQAKAEVTAVKAAAQAQSTAQALPDDQLDAELAKLGALRKD